MTIVMCMNLGFAWGEPVSDPPTVPGVEVSVPKNRLHFAVPDRRRMHMQVPENRVHVHVPDED